MSMSISLYPYQQEHFQRLLDIFSTRKVAIDASKTGSGKTIVALSLAKHFLKTVSRIKIVCPPTLHDHWKRNIDAVDLTEFTEVYSSHSLHKMKREDEKFMLIVDECHLFKNSVQRTQKLKRVIQTSQVVLMLSATPYDDNRQYTNICQLFQIQGNIKDHMSCMNFEYKTSTSFEYQNFSLDEEPMELYNKGYRTIYKSSRIQNGEPVFNPKLFTSGFKNIHDSLFEKMVEYVQELWSRKDHSHYKFVIVMNFVRHFEAFQKAFEQHPVLVLNGQTPLPERDKIIQLFQQPNLEHRIICMSGEVGSVGIELDDKTGHFPRHMIILPMSNAICFCQAVGRIQRTQTRSCSVVSIVQPVRKTTYFKNQIGRKFQVLEQFMDIPDISDSQ